MSFKLPKEPARGAHSHLLDIHKSFVHSVQLERGCSCALVGSGRQLVDFSHLVAFHREKVDSCLSRDEASDFQWLGMQLAELRAVVDSCPQQGPNEERADIFYHVLTEYTRLIRALISSLDDQESAAREGMTTGMDAVSVSSRLAAKAFTHLKELYGFQRAFVCGVLSLPDGALPALPARAFADFVINMHQLRAEQANVRNVVPGHMLHMLSAAFELPPALAALQEVRARPPTRPPTRPSTRPSTCP